MMVGADQISLRLLTNSGIVKDVEITSNRTTMAARILEGKSPKEASALIPLLFSLCGTAQHQAALGACEEALGLVISPAHKAVRKVLLCAESIAEHITRILVDWANLAGLNTKVEEVRDMRSLMGELKPLLFTDGQNDTIGGAALNADTHTLRNHLMALRADIKQTIFGIPSGEFAQLVDKPAYDHWLANTDTLPARCLKNWHEKGQLSHKWPQSTPLPQLSHSEVAEFLDADTADQFIARPTYFGKIRQTGPLSRHGNHNLIADMNNSAEKHLVAKLIDLADQLDSFEHALNELDEESALYHTKALHKGSAVVEAVRGQLCHRIWLNPENDTITRYRILAPTEWNFHHEGLLKNALLGVEATNIAKLNETAHLAVMALDPCVACAVEVEEQ